MLNEKVQFESQVYFKRWVKGFKDKPHCHEIEIRNGKSFCQESFVSENIVLVIFQFKKKGGGFKTRPKILSSLLKTSCML